MTEQNLPRLLCDFMLGRLAKWLRILGLDTEYYKPNKIENIILKSLKENRIIITRNSKISTRKTIKFILLNTDNLSEQIKHIINILKIDIPAEYFFSRCVLCNNKLVEINKELVKDKVPEFVFQINEKFYTCEKCDKIYWQGKHYKSALELKKIILNQ